MPDGPLVAIASAATANQRNQLRLFARKTAQAIIAEAQGGLLADSIGAFYKKYKFAQTGDWKEFREWQQRSVGEAARLASILAELYINSIATLTPAGDLIVTIGDIADNGLRWQQLLSILPLLSYLPIGAIIIKIGKRQIKLPKRLAHELESLNAEQRRMLLGQAAAAKTDTEAQAIIERGIAAGRKSTGPDLPGVATGGKSPGVWRVTNESMSSRARAYQTQITGKSGQVYFVNGVKFDGFSNGTLIEAKGPGYVKFIKDDGFREWFTKLPNILNQARDQVTAAAGLAVVWHVADQEMAVALRKVFADKGISILVVHTPAIHK